MLTMSMSFIILRALFLIVLFKDGFGMVTTGVGIHNGTAIPIEQAGYMALIRVNYNATMNFTCGGSIIASNFILTAGQCVTTESNCQRKHGVLPPGSFIVQIGTADSANPNHDALELKVIEIFFRGASLTSDMAILQLRETIPFSLKMYKANLPSNSVYIPIHGAKVFLDGWGENDQKVTNLLRTNLTIFAGDRCTSLGIDTKCQFCTSGVNGAGPCNGDRGSPLLRVRKGKVIQIGVVSYFPNPCQNSQNELAVYTSVSAHLEWIRSILRKNSKNGVKNAKNKEKVAKTEEEAIDIFRFMNEI